MNLYALLFLVAVGRVAVETRRPAPVARRRRRPREQRRIMRHVGMSRGGAAAKCSNRSDCVVLAFATPGLCARNGRQATKPWK